MPDKERRRKRGPLGIHVATPYFALILFTYIHPIGNFIIAGLRSLEIPSPALVAHRQLHDGLAERYLWPCTWLSCRHRWILGSQAPGYDIDMVHFDALVEDRDSFDAVDAVAVAGNVVVDADDGGGGGEVVCSFGTDNTTAHSYHHSLKSS